jgi:hypothetical protein
MSVKEGEGINPCPVRKIKFFAGGKLKYAMKKNNISIQKKKKNSQLWPRGAGG